MSRRAFMALPLWTGLVVFFAVAGGVYSAEPSVQRQGVFLAPGWGKLTFTAPAAGTYQLPALGHAAGGPVVNSDGEKNDLDELLGDKVTLLSFIYRTCDDVNGCPLSTMVLYSVANTFAKQPELQNRLRLLTMSFDPEGDTPDAMSAYKQDILGSAPLDWYFLTTQSQAELQPTLDAYQQSVVRDRKSKDGKGKFSHILRVFLIDKKRAVRNIYSLSFLHPDILVNDVKTLLMEELMEEQTVEGKQLVNSK